MDYLVDEEDDEAVFVGSWKLWPEIVGCLQ